ncbi:MAG TPA: SDR family NAD(P)-dependent oxidoreductase [Pseudonocardiaceae bacterium]|nr:SDR family NAD(P)-dependent oxidoreductase [Pseudonocardiaceae bacterium]
MSKSLDDRGEPIAVVGAACRYPDADDPCQLWELVLDQRRAFRQLPPERLDPTDYLDRDRAAPDKTYSAHAAVLEGWEFDRAAFRVPGPVFRAADPAHWLALETASRALEDSGHPGGDGLDRDRVTVIVGNTLTGEVTRARTLRLRWPYVRRVLAAAMAEADLPEDQRLAVLDRAAMHYLSPFAPTDEETLAGSLSNTIAGRVCNHFDFHCGGYTVDGACASSILAVITACRALRDGSADFALAGGVDLSLDPFELVGFAKTGALAEDRMRVYDERSDGFWPGEGCGMVALMRACDARAAGRRAYAEIIGWGISSDGRGGITRPERDGQLLALRRAYDLAGLHPSAVGLYEGHGTGTAVGDATELAALAELRNGTPVRAALGSIKANFGHTKAAAGIAGLIKATMSVASGVLPPTTGCESPHPILNDARATLRVLPEPEPWPAGARIAGVSAMGFGGINTHVLLRAPEGGRGRAVTVPRRRGSRPTPRAEVIALSGRTASHVRRVLDRLAILAPRLSEAELHDLACHLGREAPGGPVRVALIATNPEELGQRAARASARLADLPSGRLVVGDGAYLGSGVPGRVTVLFPGQGAPLYPDRGGLDAQDHAPAGTAAAQPAIYRGSLGALRWLEPLAVEPLAVIGHSLGEITGLVWAECLSPEEGERLVRERGRLMDALGTPGTGMVSVAVDEAGAHALCKGTPLVIAAYNGPGLHVLAGPLTDVRTAAHRAARQGVRATVLPVSHGFHSPAVADCAAAFKDYLQTVLFRPPRHRLVSTVCGRTLTEADSLIDLLGEQITAPVRFWDALSEVLTQTDLFCEAGPGHTLSALITESCRVPAVSVDAGSPDDRPRAEAAAALFAAGAVPDLNLLFAGRAARPIDIWRDRTFLANPCSAAPLAGSLLVEPTQVSAASPAPATRPPQGIGSQREPGEVFRDLLAAAVELDQSLIGPGTRLLSDLHLTSLRVAELLATAAERAGRERPIAPLTMADASVREVIEVIEALPAATSTPGNEPVSGIAPWIRCFAEEQRMTHGPEAPPPVGPWHVFVVDGHPLSSAATETFGGNTKPEGMSDVTALGYVPDPADPRAVATLLAVAREATRSGRLVAVTHRPGLSGFLRSLWQEHPEVGITLLRVPPTADGLRHSARYAAAEPGCWRELVLDANGRPSQPMSPPLSLGRTDGSPLGSEDVLLVSGGGKGIGYECAAALARDCGVALGLIGRAHPDRDPALAANLARLGEAGARMAYEPADVTDPIAVAAAVQRLEDRLSPVTAVLHASGMNEPARFADLDEPRLHAHLGPKVTGLRNLLATLDPPRLRLLITFGSVIGHYGLAGECHYALANGALRAETERLAADLPHTRVLNLEWSVWSGAGMGERLGVLDALLRLDVTPIPVPDGVAIFQRLVATPGLPTTVAVHGRLGGLVDAGQVAPAGRFLAGVRVHYPGVELISDARLDLSHDPYLGDHRIDGLAVLPAVVGLEAMAQAATALAGHPLREARGVVLDRPVIVPDDGARTVRVCALRRDDMIEAVVRSEETSYRVDHFRARFPLHSTEHPEVPAVPDGGTPVGPYDLYGPLYFHTGRFRRVLTLSAPGARSCRAQVSADDNGVWFAGTDTEPLLGNPGVNDATLHALQACVPHRRLLPVGCDRLVITPHTLGGVLELRAAERHAAGGEYVWDATALDPSGRPVISWSGLRLRDVGPQPRTGPWPLPLLAVHLERSATALGLDPQLQVTVTTGATRGTGPGHAPGVVSRSHLGELTLGIQSSGVSACDWEAVADRPSEEWRRLLGPELYGLVAQVQAPCAELESTVATRVWTALECLSKIGHPPTAPLVIGGVYDGGWVVLRGGDSLIASTLVSVAGVPATVAVAILTGESYASA